MEVKILVVFYSKYGHIFQLVEAVADGIREANGEAIIKRCENLEPDEYLDDYAKKIKNIVNEIPVVNPRVDLNDIDGIIIGAPTRFGMIAAEMKYFLDQTGGAWVENKLVGKPAGVFTSSAHQHGGQESTILSAHTIFLHHGAVVVGLPYSIEEQMGVDEIKGGSPYGFSTIAGANGERVPSKLEVEMARKYGRHLAEIAKKLKK